MSNTSIALLSRKEYLFAELTRISDLTKKSLSALDAEVQLRACKRLEISFERLTEEILTANAQLRSDDRISTKDFATIRTLIDAIVKNCLKAKSKEESSSAPCGGVSRGEESALPRINLPNWDGNVATWLDFKAQFDALVGHRSGLSGICKLQYLRSVLKGEPASIVNQYPLSEESYDLAYDDLARNTSISLKAASSALCSLQIDFGDFLLFELSYRNLSVKDRNRFDLDHDSDQIPQLKDLLSFVEKIARSEELSMDKEPLSSRADDRRGIKSTPIRRSLVLATKPHLCFHCNGDHMLYRCPKILSFPVPTRRSIVEKLGCCIACLYKHPRRECKSKFSCKKCNSKDHNTILHPDEIDSQSPIKTTPALSARSYSPPETDDAAKKVCNNCLSPANPAVLLATMQCRMRDAWGQELCVRAVLDPGSEISVVTSSLANRLGLPKTPATCHVEGIGRSLRKPLGNVQLKISSYRSPSITYELRAAILPRICDQLPKSRLASSFLEHFDSLELADPNFREPGEIHLLLGAEAYSDLLSEEEPAVIPGNPTAVRTKFGYVIIGKAPSSSPSPSDSAVSLCLATSPLDESIKRFWDVEEALVEAPMDPADVLCEEHFRATHQRDPTGRFVVKLPFLPNATPLGSNEEVAMKRLRNLERRLDNNPALSGAYQNCIQEYIDLGHISVAPQRVSYFLPHHAVFKESSSTTKCRVVFDCRSPDVSGLSLNDRLYRGPPLLNDISLLLINFRLFKICLMADIKMMYRMVSVHPDDRRNLVIAWRGNQYQMNRLPFGLKPAGYIAGRCIMELAELHKDEFPAAARAIRENRYADDFCTGSDTLENAKELQRQLTQLLSRGRFEIRRWSSNVPEALVDIPESFRETPVKLPSGDMEVKVLGVMWDQSIDAFIAQVVPFDSQIITKRSVLSYIAMILVYQLRFLHNCKCQENERRSGPLTTRESRNSIYLSIKLSQEESFGSEISKIKEGKTLRKELQKLSPFFDQQSGLIRVGGRLGRASFLPEDAKHPFLLAKSSHLSWLICNHYHQQYLHSGPRTTCAAIQRKFWILSLMTLVKKIIHRCQRCHRLNSKPGQPIMADIIPARLDRSYCWSNCALDFGGPFTVKESSLRKSTTLKSYICAFICLTTRAVYLEMVTSLSTQAFLAAFSRFTARRSVPNTIYSDRGTNFVGARTVLREVRDFLASHHDDLFSAAAAVGTCWRLNAPYSPNFNGCAENCIKSAKVLIKRQVGDQVLTIEEFATLLCRVEQVLNSRPISFSSQDVNDREVVYLTPGHFITGREMMVPPEEPDLEDTSLWDRWRRVRQMAQRFWKIWSTAYLHELMKRGKWTKANKNLRVGDLVYLTGMNTTPLS